MIKEDHRDFVSLVRRVKLELVKAVGVVIASVATDLYRVCYVEEFNLPLV